MLEDMALAEQPIPHRFTVEDYLQNAFEDCTELVEGVVYDVSPERSVHSQAVLKAFEALRLMFPGQLVLGFGSVRLGRRSLWDPDAYVLRADADTKRDYPLGSELEMVVEVSVSTFVHDRGVKLAAYARAGIPRYWIIQPDKNLLWDCSDPEDGEYRVSQVSLPETWTAEDLFREF